MIATQAAVELTSVEERPDAEIHRFESDQATTTPSVAIVPAVSEVSEVAPSELEPLYSGIDPDSLNKLLQVQNTARGDRSVRCTHGEYTITIDSHGEIEIEPENAEGTNSQTGKSHHR
jgi:hypothetical protein